MTVRGLHRLALAVAMLASCKSSPTTPNEVDTERVPAGIWRPTPGTTWQWQLSGTIDTSLPAMMYDIDLFDAPDDVLATLRARGIRIVCYFSAGSHEDWRADAAEFPAAAIGSPLDGWPGERWLDIRWPAVRTRMQARLARAKQRGCDAVEPDNVDGYANKSGFPLTAADQLDYNRFLAREAHTLGLSIGLKNDLDQVAQLVSEFDFAVVEECVAHAECDALAPFIAANKPVFHVEYGAATLAATVCATTKPLGFATLIKNQELDAWRVVCGDLSPR